MIYKNTIFKGDLFDKIKEIDVHGICHGCNCFCRMGAGFAKLIAINYPEAVSADCKYKTEKLGNYSYATEQKLNIYNLYTQFYPGANFSFHHFKKVIKKLNSRFKYKKVIIATPLIGLGIGGFKDKNAILEVFKNCSNIEFLIVDINAKEDIRL